MPRHPQPLTRVLGFGGSSSRMTRRIIVEAALQQLRSASKGVVPGEQFVEDDAQRVDVAAGVDVVCLLRRLLRAHVSERADHPTQPVKRLFV